MFPHVVTVYNKYKDGTVEKWQRTVLKGVFWNSIKGAVVRKTGVTSADSLQLIIPKRNGYLPPKEWLALTDKTGHWTLQSGDTVVKGNITYDIERSTKELEQFDDVRLITSVDYHDCGGDMAHWEVSAK